MIGDFNKKPLEVKLYSWTITLPCIQDRCLKVASEGMMKQYWIKNYHDDSDQYLWIEDNEVV